MEYEVNGEKYEVKPEVLDYDDIRRMVPQLDGHPKLVKWLLHLLKVDKVNRVHAACADTPGPEFTRRLLSEQFNIKLDVRNEERLDHLPEGAFITVSNHALGALDGISLIALVGSRRPKFKVMVNMILGHITAMAPNFITVDQSASTDPHKRAVSVAGIRSALRQLAQGEPLGFFPAGAISKVDRHGLTHDREWQESVLQIIRRAKVPVIPIFFHDKNSFLSDVASYIWWPLRSILLPREVFRKENTTLHISVGEMITVEEQEAHSADTAELGRFLREKTYALREKRK